MTTSTNTITTDEVGDQLLLRRPHDLAELGDDLAVEGGRAGRALARRRGRRAHGAALRHGPPPSLAVAGPARCWSAARPVCRVVQGTRDLNPQPSVLETDALPVELVPSDGLARASRSSGHAGATALSSGHDHQGCSLRVNRTGRSRTAAEPAPGRVGRARCEGASHRQPPRRDTASTLRAPRPPRLRPHRRDRRVRDAGGRRQGQGAEGRRPAGDRLRRRRARLPDPRLHRRGGGRGLPRPAEPPLHPGRRAARAQGRRSPTKTLRDSGLRRRAGPGAGHQRRQAGDLRGVRDDPRPGRRGASCPRRTGRPTRRRSGSPAASRSRCSPTRPRTTRSPSSSSRRRAPTAPRRCCSCSPSNPTGAVYTAERGRGDRPRGPSSTACGCVTDEIYEHLTYGGAETASLPVLVPELADRCIVVNGVAKTYAMTGWRVGWMIGPTDVVKAATNLQSHATSNVANVAQRAAHRRGVRRPDRGRRDARGLRPAPQDDRADAQRDRRRRSARSRTGAFYAYPSVKGLLGREIGGAHAARRPPSSPS